MTHQKTYAQTVAEGQWGLDAHTAQHLVCLLAVHPGVVVSSGRRSAQRNRAVGGVEGSFHLRGRAVDLVVPASARAAVIATIRAQRITAGCTGPEEVIDEGDHIHVAW